MTSGEILETEEERIARLVEEAIEELQKQNKSIYAIAIDMLRKNMQAFTAIKELMKKNDKV